MALSSPELPSGQLIAGPAIVQNSRDCIVLFTIEEGSFVKLKIIIRSTPSLQVLF
jgi:hypothetical protein